MSATNADIQQLIDKGQFSAAEALLKARIPDPEAPTTSNPAIQLEIIQRIKYDFPLTREQVLAEVRESIPHATVEDLARWRESGDLQYRTINGEERYFRRAVSNLFRFNQEARNRRKKPEKEKAFDYTTHIAELVALSQVAKGPEVFPVHHKLHFQLNIHPDNDRIKPGAVVRVWLPFPQEYRQQRDVKLLASEPRHKLVAENLAPQRTIYFEHVVGNDKRVPTFQYEVSFVTSGYCPKLDVAEVQPYDKESQLFREFTAERLPHLAFTPEVKSVVREVVRQESNPLKKALAIFRWVSENVPWCAEVEYSTIPSLSAKGMSARRGDCGVQGLTFITLCRAAGVPARWQSGWQTKPGDWNMHDWSEIYLEPWGWVPVDASYGVRKHDDPAVRDFLCGHMDPYRMIVNLDYGRPLQPAKTSFRSEPNDFQRGEVEIDGHNLYFDQWDWKFEAETRPESSLRGG